MKTRRSLVGRSVLPLTVAAFALQGGPLLAQSERAVLARSENRFLPSLRDAARDAASRAVPAGRPDREVPNFRGRSRSVEADFQGPDPLLQAASGANATTSLTSFDGADNDDNLATLGFRVAPPDTDGDVGPGHYVQMINLVTTIFDKTGAVLMGPFASNAFWNGMGGSCGPYNQGDPIVLYDETADRWLVSQFAFDDNLTSSTLAQCVAVSAGGDPTGAYHRYEFPTQGLPDYPKLGIATESVAMMANMFNPPGYFFGGTWLFAIDKFAMYDGRSASLVAWNLGTNEFGFVAGDLDDPADTAGFVPALFATAMSRTNLFDIWQFDVDWANPGAATVSRIAGIPIAPFDSDLCTASREACIPQPSPGERLEALSDRLMHRLQIRDFGAYKTMVAAHSVDVGGGRSGVRWYELRDSGSGWSLYQQGTFAPNDGESRWMPSIAMNARGDIGIGYLVSSTSTFLSTRVAGQSAERSGNGVLDASEATCIAGTGAQTSTARAGDYSATSVDPATDTFWHTNEYGRVTGSFEWATRVCEFEVPAPTATDVHVEDVATGTQAAGRGQQNGTATVTVFDDFGVPAGAGYTVTGNFSGSFDEPGVSAVTDATGVAVLVTSGSAKRNIVVDFCVSGVGGGALPYDPNDNASPSFACPPPPPLTDVHVASIVTGTLKGSGGSKQGTATVTVLGDDGLPQAGYSVSGQFSGALAEAAGPLVTGADGTVTFVTAGTAKGSVSFGFCVSDVTGALTYDPSDNADPGFACSP